MSINPYLGFEWVMVCGVALATPWILHGEGTAQGLEAKDARFETCSVLGDGLREGFHLEAAVGLTTNLTKFHEWTVLEWRFPSRRNCHIAGVSVRSESKSQLVCVIRAIRGSTCPLQVHSDLGETRCLRRAS